LAIVLPHHKLTSVINLQTLSDLFAEKDLQLPGEKAQRLSQERGIWDGFEKTCLVKSESLQMPHTMKAVSNNGYLCDNQCLSFKLRKLCAHTVAVAAHNRNVAAHFNWYRNQEKKTA